MASWVCRTHRRFLGDPSTSACMAEGGGIAMPCVFVNLDQQERTPRIVIEGLPGDLDRFRHVIAEAARGFVVEDSMSMRVIRKDGEEFRTL